MSEAVRVGVIGAGAIAQVAHLPVLATFREVQIVGICDNDTAKASALSARFGVRDVFDDIEDLLTYSKPDVVVVCTPNHLHEVHVLTAIARGVHVFCERPLALRSDGAARIAAAMRRSSAAVFVGMNHRFRSDVQAVRGFARADLGALRAIRAGWYIFRPARGLALGWRERSAESGGGAMFDLGLPLIDVGLWLAGSPRVRSVTGTIEQDSASSGVEDSGCALITCEGGVSFFVDVSWRHVGDSERFWLDLLGTRGSASVVPLGFFKESHGTPVNVTPTGASGRENTFTASYRAEWAHFLAIVKKAIERPTLDDQLVLHQVVEAVYRSAAEGRSVAL